MGGAFFAGWRWCIRLRKASFDAVTCLIEGPLRHVREFRRARKEKGRTMLPALIFVASAKVSGGYGLRSRLLAFVFRQQAAGAQQRGEATAALGQLIERALLDDPALIEEQDEIGVADR